jgi:steroid Delta-isomerase
MAASRERVREVVDRYVELVASGTADEIVALYAEHAVVEDPVGSAPRVGHAAIRELYATLEGLDQRTRLLTLRIAGGEAAFHFEVATLADGMTYTLAPVDVMVLDDAGLITSMRAYWGEEDMSVG